MIEPARLLTLAEEMAARADEDPGYSALAVLASHAALEALVNRLGGEVIASFNYRGRFLPKWHDLCEPSAGASQRRRSRRFATCLRQVDGKPEGTSLGVSTDAPPISRVDDLTAELADPLQRRVHVRNREIRERHPIAGARPPRVEAERGASPVGLPAFTFTLDAALKLHVQERAPEPASPGRVVGGELHESKQRGHATTIAPAYPTGGCRARNRVFDPHRHEASPKGTSGYGATLGPGVRSTGRSSVRA